MQSSRKKGGEFIKEFAKVMKPCVMHVYREGDNQTHKAVQRILDVWVERRVLPAAFVDEIKSALKGEISTKLTPSQKKQVDASTPIICTTRTCIYAHTSTRIHSYAHTASRQTQNMHPRHITYASTSVQTQTHTHAPSHAHTSHTYYACSFRLNFKFLPRY